MDAPAYSLVMKVVNGREFPLSRAEYWSDGEGFVVRSSEFDCFADGSDLDEALVAFGQAVFDYADCLQQRHDRGTATETERATLKLLSDRLSRIYLEQRRAQFRRKGFFSRRRNEREERRSLKPVVSA